MDFRGRLLLEATVISVGEGPYYYPACKQCYSKLMDDEGDEKSFICLKCNRIYPVSEVNQRYRLCLTISDGMTLVDITAFGNMLTPYFGCPASELQVMLDRQLEKTQHHFDSSLLKCALEKSLVGCSLLFGFKGVIKKPKGVPIYLKDVVNLGKTSSVGWQCQKRDLIVVQMMPQSNSQYPIPVIHDLRRLCTFIQSDEKNFGTVDFDLETILYGVPNNFLKDFPHNGTDKSPVERNTSDDDFESNLSNSLSDLDSEISVGFSITSSSISSQNSCIVRNCDASKLDSFELNENAISGSKLWRGLLRDYSVGCQTPLSSRKSSWCVRKGLKSKKHKNCNESRRSSRRAAKMCDSIGAQDSFLNSPNFFTSPEQSRKQPVFESPPNAFINFSIDKVVSSPRKNESTLGYTPLKSQCAESVALNSHFFNFNDLKISGCAERNKNFPNLLAQKSKDSRIKNFENHYTSSQTTVLENKGRKNLLTLKAKKEVVNNKVLQDSDCSKLWEATLPAENVTNVQLFSDMPESEDVDLFLLMANIENLELENSKLRKSPSILKMSTARRNKKTDIDWSTGGYDEVSVSSDIFNGCDGITKPSVNFQENDPKTHPSFLDMPESEDVELFLAAANLEQLNLEPTFSDSTIKKGEIDAKAIKGQVSPDIISTWWRNDSDRKNHSSKLQKFSSQNSNNFPNQSTSVEMPEVEESDFLLALADIDEDKELVISQSDPADSNTSDIERNYENSYNSRSAIEIDRNFDGKSKACVSDNGESSCICEISVENLNDCIYKNEVDKSKSNCLKTLSPVGFGAKATCLRNLQIPTVSNNSKDMYTTTVNDMHNCDNKNVSYQFQLVNNSEFDSYGSFNDSCDLFNSPVPYHYSSTSNKEGALKTDNLGNNEHSTSLNLNQAKQNSLCSLFSSYFSNSSSSPVLFPINTDDSQCILRNKCASCTPVILNGHNQTSNLDGSKDYSMDLFSQGLDTDTPEKSEKKILINDNPKLYSSNLFCDVSSDLFSP